MKAKALMLILFFCTFFAFPVFSQDEDEEDMESHYEKLDAEEFKHLLEFLTNEQLVDLRHEHPFKKGHIFNALNIPFHSARFQKDIKALDKSKPLLLYGDNSGEVKSAMEFILKQGFIEVYLLGKGMDSWEKKGLTVVQ